MLTGRSLFTSGCWNWPSRTSPALNTVSCHKVFFTDGKEKPRFLRNASASIFQHTGCYPHAATHMQAQSQACQSSEAWNTGRETPFCPAKCQLVSPDLDLVQCIICNSSHAKHRDLSFCRHIHQKTVLPVSRGKNRRSQGVESQGSLIRVPQRFFVLIFR